MAKVKQTIYLVSRTDGQFNVYDYFIPTRAFRFKEDAEQFIEQHKHESCDWELDTVILE